MASRTVSPRRVAVVLFNLGGPDRLSAVRPFLFNLFRDPAIISLPALVRYPLAALIALTRGRSAKANYARMGGGSPLIPETEAQARALEAKLAATTTDTVRVFTAMRYWKPESGAAAASVAAFAPEQIVLLPLYPQFSTTTTASSMKAWFKAYKGPGKVKTVCCYPVQTDFIEAHALRIRQTWEDAGRPGNVRLLFSAHGLPLQVVEGGDPYQVQIEATATAVAARLEGILTDWRVCYQSRVGRLVWLGPSTPEEIEQAGKEGLGVIICPIAFVSEHVETLVELDHDYAMRATELEVSPYIRVPALSTQDHFIDGLAKVALAGISGEDGIGPGSGFRCDACWTRCPLRTADQTREKAA